MPNHRKRLGELSVSESSSASSLHGVNDLNDLKDVVLDLARRLEILEKVFVFVDFEQINQVIAKLGPQAETAAPAKVGLDSALTAPKWDPLPASRLVETVPEEAKKPQGSWQALPEPSDVKKPTPVLQPPRASGPALLEPLKTGPKLGFSQSNSFSKDLKDPLRYGLGITSPKDDAEFRSTSSTWNQTFSSSWGPEAEVEPERLNTFMKQAIRPRWKAEHQKQNGSQPKAEPMEAGNDVDEIMNAILDEKSKQMT
mmetsp:Transcript_9570/g.17142  ORF Transcript_9570/g.17142 Transcript_9570/m.17142 type:complete len:255 (+) Transcript_9570:41-805(+)